MADKDSATNQLLKQISQLQAQVTTLRQKPANPMDTAPKEELPADSRLIEITNTMRHFLETTFSGTMDNDNRTACIKRIGVPNCDQICCFKLNGVLKAVLPTDTIKADGCQGYNGCRISTGNHSGVCRGRGPDAGKGGIHSPSGTVLDGQCTPTYGAKEVQKAAVEAEPVFEIYG